MVVEVRTTHISKNSWAVDLAQQFVKKTSRFEKIEFKIFKDEKKLFPLKESGSRIVLCDERGESFSSRKFAEQIGLWRDGGISRLIFVVGGPFGVDESQRLQVDLSLKLSTFVMNQEVALTVLMEQIFRSYTIIHNHPYHND